jgi:hypothetical protein
MLSFSKNKKIKIFLDKETEMQRKKIKYDIGDN